MFISSRTLKQNFFSLHKLHSRIGVLTSQNRHQNFIFHLPKHEKLKSKIIVSIGRVLFFIFFKNSSSLGSWKSPFLHFDQESNSSRTKCKNQSPLVMHYTNHVHDMKILLDLELHVMYEPWFVTSKLSILHPQTWFFIFMDWPWDNLKIWTILWNPH